jgi:uncharacterized membrane protein YdjX (TVP38/TMEM64 family)
MSREPDSMEPPPPRAWSRWILLTAVGLALLTLILFAPVHSILNAAVDWTEHLGAWGAVAFIVFYAGATVLMAPGSVLTLAAGALFGLARGVLYVWLGAMLGALSAFLLGRYLARNWVARKLTAYPTFAAIDRGVANEGWKIVMLVRLSPVFPFALVNYGFGLTQVPLGQYLAASAVGMIPGAMMYVYIGSLAHAGVSGHGLGVFRTVLYGVGLLATAAVTALITRTARRALAQRSVQDKRPG